ncbi:MULTISPECIES: type II toxin-antitoxin system RelE/ParE family toxin [Stenotrophomonas]|jgi:putative addiction module killer protein|uniref:Type II toxin-antitoxin system RelE/ParE family toxin n=1 Tax=Stenotrophomonas riyadhensis TaxID=2859893 RepID=A0ABT2XMJ1_9GAMM|nr:MULTISPECIES: type II toxin-antitoxin system RelE/ParE family toxin [Stenotrophomonas]EKU9960113.1 type II toxin-antitoxin system RelE/ParE family toxin [Stenotrophomonas maltophilia]EKU9986143.1 type II toxin-antitoxin system RelE/ParE family toxin [Stenotrophomonas maltophilia]ELF4102604.1 type II toxin-antitoxin system RelE/ParE family toxin [Stenotrophomonas maltophilia]MBA0430279.1 type II toxin-antitoxin system RelE/ParE family toxin [Stenotrophomonas maltophilia]MBH1620218.1 type II 
MATLQATETFTRWLRGLNNSGTRAVIVERLQRVARGLEGDVRSVGHGVSELRINHGPGYRVYFTRRGRSIVVLLHGGDKSSQRRDIEKAVRLAELL